MPWHFSHRKHLIIRGSYYDKLNHNFPFFSFQRDSSDSCLFVFFPIHFAYIHIWLRYYAFFVKCNNKTLKDREVGFLYFSLRASAPTFPILISTSISKLFYVRTSIGKISPPGLSPSLTNMETNKNLDKSAVRSN